MISNPQERATSTRRKKLQKVYASKEWKKGAKEFVSGRKCEWCGAEEKLLPHHPYLESYKDGSYLDLFLSGCIVLCNRCHFALHKGLVLCRKCKQHYHLSGAECCRSCFMLAHPEIVAAREKRKEDAKALKKKLTKEAKEKWVLEHPKVTNRSPKPDQLSLQLKSG